MSSEYVSVTGTADAIGRNAGPDLAPFQFSNMDDIIVISNVTYDGTVDYVSTEITTSDTVYYHWGYANFGDTASGSFDFQVYLDDVLQFTQTASSVDSLGGTIWRNADAGTLTAGQHTLRLELDTGNAVAEEDESNNSYSRTFTVVDPNQGLPDLEPYTPAAWADSMVVSNATGANVDTSILTTDTVYIDFAVLNAGNVASAGYEARIYLDGSLVFTGTSSSSLSPSFFNSWEDASIGMNLAAGTYTLEMRVDEAGAVSESDETDNTFTRTFTVIDPNASLPNLQAFQPGGWDSAISVTNQTGTNADDMIREGDTVYIDWAFANFGTAHAGPFRTSLYLDDVLEVVGSSTGLAVNFFGTFSDWSLGVLSEGTYTLRLEIDDLSQVAESIEGDNTFTRTFTVLPLGPADIRVSPESLTIENPATMAMVSQASGESAAIPMGGWRLSEAEIQKTESLIVDPATKLTDPEMMADAEDSVVYAIVTMRPPVRKMATMNWRSETAREDLRAVNRQQCEQIEATLPSLAIRDELLDNFGMFSGFYDAEALAALAQHPDVFSIEPVTYAQRHDLEGHALMAANTYLGTYDGAGVTIAIVDDGVDYNHPDLGGGPIPNGKIISGYDTADEDNDVYSGSNPHGTACAGIAAGDPPGGSAGSYIGGIAPGAKLAALKVFGDGAASASIVDIIEAWNWCVTNQNLDPNNPIMVISNSLGGGYFTSATTGAYFTAAMTCNSVGITVLASSGNDGFCDGLGSPASAANIISVGAVYDANIGTPTWCVSGDSCVGSPSGCPTGFSATEASTTADQVPLYSNSANFLDVLAPSNAAAATDLVGAPGYTGSDYTQSFGGTSAACPYAAGAVAAIQHAAMVETGSFLAPDQVLSVLTSTGVALNDAKSSIEKPRVNLEAAINSVIGSTFGNFTIYNDGFSDLTVSSITPETSAPWLTIAPAPPYTIGIGEQQVVTVTVDFDQAPAGTTATRLLLASNDPDEDPYPTGVTVNVENPGVPPMASAGVDATLTDTDRDGFESYTADGSGSIDNDGTIAAYLWEWVDGGPQTRNTASFTADFPTGQTVLTLTVTDDDGLTDQSTVTVTVNSPPTAVATANPVPATDSGDGTQSVTLDGSGSSDDVSIVSYDWTWNDGGAQSAAGEITAEIFNLGVTTVTLTITDTNGAIDTDVLDIIVEPTGGNLPPIADAGPDIVLEDIGNDGRQLASLNGSGSSDPDYSITDWLWNWSSGNTSGETTSASFGLGTNTVTLTVIDSFGAQATDSVNVTVRRTSFGDYIDGENLAEADAQPDSNGDSDSLTNLEEFAFGGRASIFDDPGLLPEIAVVDESNNLYMQVSYRQMTGGTGTTGVDYVANGLRYWVEVAQSGDFSSWETQDLFGQPLVELVGIPVDNGNGTETVTVRYRLVVDNIDSILARLRLELQ